MVAWIFIVCLLFFFFIVEFVMFMYKIVFLYDGNAVQDDYIKHKLIYNNNNYI